MEKTDLQSGKITYNEFNIDFSVPYSEQVEELLEDLIQIEYKNGYLIDLGWYPEFNPQGKFIVQVIKNYDWENPIFMEQSRDKKQLEKILLKAINLIMVLL
ncbi:MAG: hypothetical protein HDT39_06990 [Lachnospiraceae bacterium]|nr:hypothetical protein [Lachnospiraceae bacterium]